MEFFQQKKRRRRKSAITRQNSILFEEAREEKTIYRLFVSAVLCDAMLFGYFFTIIFIFKISMGQKTFTLCLAFFSTRKKNASVVVVV